jgi:hypothetical protein
MSGVEPVPHPAQAQEEEVLNFSFKSQKPAAVTHVVRSPPISGEEYFLRATASYNTSSGCLKGNPNEASSALGSLITSFRNWDFWGYNGILPWAPLE